MIKFDLFTRRVAARVLSASIFAALALLGFAATFQFAEEAGDFARLRDAAWSTALRLPQIAIFVLPLAALIGSAAAFRLLAARREMLAARACGYSPRAAAAAAAAAAAVLAAAHFLAGEYALAPAENALRVLGAPAGREARVFGRALWLRDGGDYARAGRVEFGAEFLEDISIYRISPTARLTAVIEAPRAHWREGEGAADSFWDLQDARVIEVSESSRRDFRFSNFEWRGGLTPEVFAAFLVKPRAMATSHLRAAISRLGDNRQSAAPFIEEFWRRIVLSVSFAAARGLRRAFRVARQRRLARRARFVGRGSGRLLFRASPFRESRGGVVAARFRRLVGRFRRFGRRRRLEHAPTRTNRIARGFALGVGFGYNPCFAIDRRNATSQNPRRARTGLARFPSPPFAATTKMSARLRRKSAC